MPTGIDRTYREEGARILGAVVRYTGDLQLAEDAVHEAFARALARTRAGERLDNPAAWITTVARRIAVDAVRREQTALRALPALAADARNAPEGPEELADFSFSGDERLELILLMCHPDIAEQTRVALALRFVCGVPTADVAATLLVSEPTMAARLTRAKKRIHDSSIRFTMADDHDVTARMLDALTVVYLMYTAGHAPSAVASGSPVRAEAIALARDAHRVRPGDPETAGLLALLLLTEARQATRLDEAGDLVDLASADRTRWDAVLLAEGERLATRALLGFDATRGGGRFALQAGIAGLHATAPAWGATDWTAASRLYDGLVAVWPSPSARLGRLIARGHAPGIGPAAAGAELDAATDLFAGVIAAQTLAARADMHARTGAPGPAADAYRAALALEPDERVRRFLVARIAALG